MKRTISILSIFALIAVACAGQTSTLTLSWTPGDNPTGTQHILLGGTSPGVYTFTNIVPYAQTTCTVSNLVSGTRYYFVVVETDGADLSPYSNEANGKTKLHPPKDLTVTAP